MNRLFVLPAVWTGLEPATPCVTGMYSNQLNYQTSILDDTTPALYKMLSLKALQK